MHLQVFHSQVDFVVHFTLANSDSSLTSRIPASSVPSHVGPYSNGSTWYVAARFTFTEYNDRHGGNNFILGSGSKTIGLQDITYTNQELMPGRRYSVYCTVTGTDWTGVRIQHASYKCNTETITRSCFVYQKVVSTTSDGVGKQEIDRLPATLSRNT